MTGSEFPPQYFGALLVMSGIGVALWPRLTSSEEGPALPGQGAAELALWSAVMILSCVPMTLSRRASTPRARPAGSPPGGISPPLWPYLRFTTLLSLCVCLRHAYTRVRAHGWAPRIPGGRVSSRAARRF